MAIGLQKADEFVSKATAFYQRQFGQFDEAEDHQLDFPTFERLILSLDPQRHKWKIMSIF